MKLFALLSIALVAQALPQVPFRADNIQVIDCGRGDDDAFRLNSLTATPYPPRSGENVTVEATGTVLKEIPVCVSVLLAQLERGLIRPSHFAGRRIRGDCGQARTGQAAHAEGGYM